MCEAVLYLKKVTASIRETQMNPRAIPDYNAHRCGVDD